MFTPDRQTNPPDFYEEELFECLECGTFSKSEFCSQSCHTTYML